MNYPFTSDGDVDYFQFLAIMNRAAVNTDELVSLDYIVESFMYIPKSGVAESYGTLQRISTGAIPISNPASSEQSNLIMLDDLFHLFLLR